MNAPQTTSQHRPLRLKDSTGWFPAGKTLLNAMTLVSDGAFKLFVFLCLNADRPSATYAASSYRLATAIGKSRHSVEAYTAELKAKGLCSVIPSRVPYIGTTFQINPQYWPYQSDSNAPNAETSSPYVDSVRNSFLALGCTSGRFGPADQCQAQDFQQENIPLSVVEDALLIGACRKYISWLNHGPNEPISSLRYFQPLIEEVQERPFPSGYRDHLRRELEKLSSLWRQQADSLRKRASDKPTTS
jgi:hypothetical protein